MTGYQSKKAAAQDKLAQPAQEPWPEEPFGHMAGGVQPPQRTEQETKTLAGPKWPLKYQWVTSLGYVVWRDVFEGNMKCSLMDAVIAHKEAVFVCEEYAKNYCDLRNTKIDSTPPAPQRQPLTDEEIADYLGDEYHDMSESELRFFRLGEAATKEKNNG